MSILLNSFSLSKIILFFFKILRIEKGFFLILIILTLHLISNEIKIDLSLPSATIM
jgi:hypothetical protein